MGFRRVKAKKYSGISEYYRDSDIDTKTVAYYIVSPEKPTKPLILGH